MTGLAVAPELLLWGGSSEALRRPVEAEYSVLLHETFRRLNARREDLADGISEDVPHEAVARVVLAPRSVRRLLWPRRGEVSRTERFLRKALQAERVVLGLEGLAPPACWTADCRAYVRSDGSITCQPTIAGGLIPLDLRSPHARSLDLMGGSRIVPGVRSSPSSEAEHRTTTRLEQAWRGINATEGATAECVAAWTRVIIPQADPNGLFWSGSNGEYVGRVVLVNSDQERVSIEEVVDALVHEAIHGFLYMHESVEPWVVDRSLYTDEPAIESPWSGTLLPVRPFMQACFVWYGLAMFWALHVGSTVFDRERTHYLLSRSLSGFRRRSLTDLLRPSREGVRPEMLDVIDELQQTVRSLLA